MIYNNIGDYKRAFKSHKKFKIFNDSLFNKENIQKITQLEYEYKYKDELASAEKRELKLTVSRALSDQIEARERSLASVKRARQKEKSQSSSKKVQRRTGWRMKMMKNQIQ